MLIKIVIITACLLALAAVGLGIKYYKQKRSPFYKKKRMNFFKKSELSGNENKKNN